MAFRGMSLSLFIISLMACATDRHPAGALDLIPVTASKNPAINDWPSHFKVTCGDLSHVVPFDPKDMMGTLVHIDFSGEAQQIQSREITGVWVGGVGYEFTMTLSDGKLLGSEAPVRAKLSCYYKENSGSDQMLKCFSGLRDVPGLATFNQLSAELPLPSSADEMQRNLGLARVTVRTSVDLSSGNKVSNRFYDFTREMICRYSP